MGAVLNEKSKVGESVSAILIPANEPEKFKSYLELELTLTFDGLNHHLYSGQKYLQMLDAAAHRRFCRFVQENGKSVKFMRMTLKEVITFK